MILQMGIAIDSYTQDDPLIPDKLNPQYSEETNLHTDLKLTHTVLACKQPDLNYVVVAVVDVYDLTHLRP